MNSWCQNLITVSYDISCSLFHYTFRHLMCLNMNSHDLNGIFWNVSVHDLDFKEKVDYCFMCIFSAFGQFKHLKMENLYQKWQNMVKSSDFEGQEAQKSDQKQKNRSLLTLKHHTCASYQPFHSTENENPVRALTLQGRPAQLSTHTWHTPSFTVIKKRWLFFNEGHSTIPLP